MSEVKNNHVLREFFSEHVYISPLQASRELQRRRKNHKLRQEVEFFLNSDIPDVLRDEPKAVLARNIISPNNLFFEFLRLAKKTGLDAWCLEFISDKFCAENPDKYYLGKLCFDAGIGKGGGEKLSTLKVIDLNKSEGKKMHDVYTLWGENLVDFHHGITKKIVPLGGNFFNATDWIERNGCVARKFYARFLALFLCHGILFENYLMDDHPLIDDLFMPSIKTLYDRFGIYPLIVPIVPIDQEENYKKWLRYSAEIKEHVFSERRVERIIS